MWETLAIGIAMNLINPAPNQDPKTQPAFSMVQALENDRLRIQAEYEARRDQKIIMPKWDE